MRKTLVGEVNLDLIAGCYAYDFFLASAAFINAQSHRCRLVSAVVWHGCDRQYTSPRFCQIAPGVKNTPDGRRKTRLESHIAVNTYVPPGRTFSGIDVG